MTASTNTALAYDPSISTALGLSDDNVLKSLLGYLLGEIPVATLIERHRCPANASGLGATAGPRLNEAIIHAGQSFLKAHNAIVDLVKLIYSDPEENAEQYASMLRDHHDCKSIRSGT